MDIVKVSTKGQIVLPAALRRELGIDAGSRLLVTRSGDAVTLSPVPSNPVSATFGAMAHLGNGTQAPLEDRRRERERELNG